MHEDFFAVATSVSDGSIAAIHCSSVMAADNFKWFAKASRLITTGQPGHSLDDRHEVVEFFDPQHSDVSNTRREPP